MDRFAASPFFINTEEEAMEEQEILSPVTGPQIPDPDNNVSGIEKAKSFVHEWVGSFVSALLIVIVLFTFAFRMVCCLPLTARLYPPAVQY